MTITYTKTNLIAILRQKSHLEVQDIPDPAMRDNARAGLDKTDEIVRCVADGVGQVKRHCWRWLDDDYDTPNNQGSMSFDTITFTFDLSERRRLNKGQPLEAAIRSLIIEYALAKFYSTVNQGELSKKHSLAAIDAGNEIDELLYTKKPPRAWAHDTYSQ